MVPFFFILIYFQQRKTDTPTQPTIKILVHSSSCSPSYKPPNKKEKLLPLLPSKRAKNYWNHSWGKQQKIVFKCWELEELIKWGIDWRRSLEVNCCESGWAEPRNELSRARLCWSIAVVVLKRKLYGWEGIVNFSVRFEILLGCCLGLAEN